MLVKKGLMDCLDVAISSPGDYCRGWNDAVDAMPKWISVEERLPEDGKIVLGAFLRYDGYEINITKYCVYPNRNVWFIGDMNAVGSTPTHWMPLPEPPKEET